MREQPYDSEDLLQGLLAKYPSLLAGDEAGSRRWLLVKREAGVPSAEGAGGRWSLDHLFVDQDAVPTLVEVKRSTDTRIRREVVGQMLDYAANGVRYWPIPELKAAFSQSQTALGQEPAEVIAQLCDDADVTMDEFFTRVGDNLRAGRIRMVFVADVIPDELMRITEFLNEQMSPAEVFAVEVKQYRAQGYEGTVIAPAVYSRTATASVKSSGRRPSPDRGELLSRSAPSTLEVLDLMEAFAAESGLVVHHTASGSLVKTPRKGAVAER